MRHSHSFTAMASVKTAIVIAIIAYSIYVVYQEPVPVEASQKLQMKIILSIVKLLHPMCLLADRLGLVRDEALKKYLSHHGSRIMNFGNPGIRSEDTMFDGVPVRVYRPEGSTGVLPGMVYYHGGGWVIGSIESHDAVTAFFAREAQIVVVSVDYRLSPQNTRKDGLDDCVAVTKYFINNAEKYSVDPLRIVVAGDSAGGNLASVVPIVLRDENFSPMPKLQLLIYPSVQSLDLQLPSFQQNSNGPLLGRHELTWFLSMVHNKDKGFMDDFDQNLHVPKPVREEMAQGVLSVDLLPKELLYPPYKPPRHEEKVNMDIWNKRKAFFLDGYHSPILTKDHSNLPEAYIFTAQYDQLRDDGFLYAHKLKEAGVKVTHYNCPYGWHGMINAVKYLNDSQSVMTKMSSFVRERL